jgi:hypothetical protein
MAYIRRAKVGGAWNYCDYLDDCAMFGLDLRDTKTAFPRQWARRRAVVHAEAERIRRIERAAQDAELRRRMAEEAKARDVRLARIAARYARLEKRKTRAFLLRIPRKTEEFVQEGRGLHNCLGEGYADRMAGGTSILAWVRRTDAPNTPFVAVEYNPKERAVLQCYGAKNGRPPASVLAFVNRVFRPRKRAA